MFYKVRESERRISLKTTALGLYRQVIRVFTVDVIVYWIDRDLRFVAGGFLTDTYFFTEY